MNENKTKGFRGFFETRPMSKSLLLAAIFAVAAGFALGIQGIVYAGYALGWGALITALFFDG